MQILLRHCKDYSKFNDQVILIDASTKFSSLGLEKAEANAVQKYFDDKIGPFYRRVADGKTLSLVKIDTTKEEFKMLEEARKAGNQQNKFFNGRKATEASLYNATGKTNLAAAFAEGFALSNYEFLKYKT